jgi:membrane fusion protein (multidrug efflux system)
MKRPAGSLTALTRFSIFYMILVRRAPITKSRAVRSQNQIPMALSAFPTDQGGPPAASIDDLLLMAATVVALIASAFGGTQFWNYHQSYESTDDAEVDAPITHISSRINGTITGLYVEDYQRVKAGQLLVQLDPRGYEVAVQQARAQVAQAEAGINSGREQYALACARIRQSQARDFQARRDQQRYSTLLRLGVVSQVEYDHYNADAVVQSANVKVDQADAAVALRSIACRLAEVDAAKARLDQAILNLGYTRIVAPFNGIVRQRTGELGQRLEQGQSLMALSQVNDLWITANFKETQLERMHGKQAVTIHVDAIGWDFRGHVQNIPGETASLDRLLPPKDASGNYVKAMRRLPVPIVFDPNQDPSRLLPGMSALATVWLK